MSTKRFSCLAALTLSLALAQSAFAIDAAGLTDVIRNANILKYDKSPKVTIRGAQITTSVDPMGPPGKTSDQDLKIDALLVAKSLYDAAGQELNSCKIIFSNGGKDAKYTIISRQKVAEYSSGSVNAQELLGSLALTAVVQENQPDVVEGPFYERRMLVWERIENLRKQGTGVKPFEHLYSELEASIKANDEQKTLFNKLTSLEEKLSGQETQIAQARKVAQGKGIHGTVKGSSQVQTSIPASAQAQSSSNGRMPLRLDSIPPIVRGKLLAAEAAINNAKSELGRRGDLNGVSEAGGFCNEFYTMRQNGTFENVDRRFEALRTFLQNKGLQLPNVANSKH